MRTTLKLVIPLAISVVLVSILYAGYQVRTERRNLYNDLIHRSASLADSLQNSLEPFSGTKTDKNLQHITQHFTQREHLLGVIVYDAAGNVLARSSAGPEDFFDLLQVKKIPAHPFEQFTARSIISAGRGEAS